MKKVNVFLLICFITSVVSAQDYKDVGYWLDGIDLPSSENTSMQLSNYELENKSSMSYSFSLKDKSFNFLQIKPLSYSNQLKDWKPTNNILLENKKLNYYEPSKLSFRNPKNINLKMSYKLTNRLSLELSGYYQADKYRKPIISDNLLYRSEIATNISYSITKNLKIKSGMQYMYNPATRRWEYAYMTGIAFNF